MSREERKVRGRDEKEAYGIQAWDIRHAFGKKQVLNGVTLQIPCGEIFGLLGPSGAGKTTLIKILTGQLRPTGGRAETAAGARIGIMMDEFGVYERLSCYDNLKLFARLYGLSGERIDSALAGVGLAGAKKKSAMHLSKGMRSRLILARALLPEPDVLFLDEPVSGLDPGTAEEIHGLLRRQQERGVTIFLTTHNMAEAQSLCGSVALLSEGRIVEQGSPEEICRRYDHQRKIRLHLCDGRDIELVNGASSAGEVASYLEREMVRTMHSTEPDLESVFMELTGRGLD